MVSISHSQIKSLLVNNDDNYLSSKKLIKSQLIAKLILQAENEGYFTHLTPEYLNSNFNIEKSEFFNYDSIYNLKFIKYISLQYQNIQKIDYLEYCRNLVYLNVSRNFISDITALKLCDKLICLDLSTNLIQELPGLNFWRKLSSLQIIYLHDNPIPKPDSIMGLYDCSSIKVLTLWNTPLAVKQKYRHIIVNSIWSLKILDHHFVSDEEIIEDACFHHSKFRTLSDSLKIRSYYSYDDKLINSEKYLTQFIIEMNRLESHLSPVLIIQRWIRGFLVRKLFKVVNQKQVRLPSEDVKFTQIMKISNLHGKEDVNITENVNYLTVDPISLTKISTLENLEREANVRNLISASLNMITYRSFNKVDDKKCSPEHKTKLSQPTSFSENQKETTVSFRFNGLKVPITSKTPFSEINFEKYRCYNLIREADKNYHEKVLSELPEIKSKPIKKLKENALFRKAQGCIGLCLLQNLDKTDHEIKEMARCHEKVYVITSMKNEREINLLRVKEAHTRKLALVKTQHNEHKYNLERSIENQKEILKKEAEELRIKNDQAAKKRAKLMNVKDFSLYFRSKQTGACNAMDKFVKMTFRQEQMQMNKLNVSATREKRKLDMETVRAYLENQALIRRAERNMEHTALDLEMFQQTNNRMNKTKMRMEKLKTIRRLVTCPQLPSIHISLDSVVS